MRHAHLPGSGRPARTVAALLVALLSVLSLPFQADAGGGRHRHQHPSLRDGGVGVLSSGPVMTLNKAVEGAPDPLLPGSTFSYKLTLSCSSLKESCVNAVIEDTLPPEFDVTALPQSTPTRTVTYDAATRKLTIAFTSPLPAPPNPEGSVGLTAGATADVDIAMRVPESGPLKDGDSVTNTATAKADNASQVISSVTQTVTVPKNLDAKATKSWQPGSDVAHSDGESTVTLGTANTSNNTSKIAKLGIEESSPGLFDNFDLLSVGPVTKMPAGADQVTVLVCTKPVGSPCTDAELIAATPTAGPGLALPDGVTAGQVTGVRYEFSNSAGTPLPYDPTGGTVQMRVKLRRTVRSTGADLNPVKRRTVKNCADPRVQAEGSKFTVVGAPACTNHDILPNIATVDVGKRFFPDSRGDFTQSGTAVLGQGSRVSAIVTAANTSPFPVATMTITEPSGSAASEFDKLDVSTLRVTFPSGATTAAVSVTCRNGTVLPVRTLTAPQTLPAGCPDGSPPARVSVTFTGTAADGSGTIVPGASAGLGVHGKLNSKVTAQDVKDGVLDCADGSATNPANGSGTAASTSCATLPVEEPREDGRGVKTASQKEIPPGQPVTYTLGLVNDGNVFLPNVVMTDPPDPAAKGNPFDSIRITGLNYGSGGVSLPLVLELYDPTTRKWVEYQQGDTALMARAKGVRLRSPEGLPVGASMRVDVTVELRDGVTSGSLRNCFTTSIDGRTPKSPTCSEDVAIGPARSGASLQKSLSPSSIIRPTPGLNPLDVTVRLTVLNTGNLSLKRLQVTDTDPAFFDSVTAVRLAGVTFPNGADRVQVDVCTTGCAAKPPVFITGTPTDSTTPGFPAGVAPADIQGVRVTFTSSTGGYTIVPATAAPGGGGCPGSSVCLVVQARTALRSDPGKPIPDTIPDTASGAGESRLQPEGSTFPIPPDTATLTITEGRSQLRVEKSPAETVLSPGNPAPFTLTTRNTGSAPVQDLVIVDQIPAGLRFDDSYNGGGGLPYTLVYTLAGGSPKPVEVKFEPVRDADGVITKLVWRFPGWQLRPNDQVAVTYQVKLAGGVAAGTVIPNVYGAGSDSQPGIACDPSSPRLGQVTDDAGYGQGTFCTSTAKVTTRAGVSFDAAKWVAGDPTLGFQDSNSGLKVPVGDPRCPSLTHLGVAYTRYPCIALTYPGQRFSYLLRIENTGTSPAVSLRLLDVFPAPHDTGVLLGGDERGTEWDSVPELNAPVDYSGPGNPTITYTSTNNPCGQLVATPERNCNAAAWRPATADHTTAFEAGVQFPGGMAPGNVAFFRMGFDAPADLSIPGYPSVAWNSFAHSETVTSGGSSTVLPVTEPPKAGIGLVFGNVRILKSVVDPPDGAKVGPFEVEYTCVLTTASGGNVEVRSGKETFSTARPLDLSGVPAGAVCRIWESDSAGARTDHLGPGNAITVTVRPADRSSEVQTDTITNSYPRRDLLVVKRVTGEAADEFGGGPFTIQVDCTFNGARLPDFPQDLVFTGNATQAITDLPVGTVCDAVETVDGGATHVTIKALSSTRVVADFPGPNGTTPVVGSPQSGGQPATFIVTNTFATGTLVLNKRTAGPGADYADRPFRFHVLCDFNGHPGLISRDVELQRPELEAELKDLPVGAVCAVTETDKGGADGFAEPVHTLTIKEGTTDLATAALENHFSAGRLTLHKTLSGPAGNSSYLKDARFALHVMCERDGPKGTVTFLDHTYTVTAGTPLTVPVPLPIGARCWAGEPRDGGAFATTVDHPDAQHPAVVTLDQPAISITADNEYRESALHLTKITTGSGRDRAAGLTFTLELTCVLPTSLGTPDLTLVDKRRYQLRPGQTVQVTDLGFTLPAGARCYATEPDHQGAATVTIDHGTPADAAVLPATGAGTITADNDYTGTTPLPDTGSDPLPWTLAAATLLLLGTATALHVRRRR